MIVLAAIALAALITFIGFGLAAMLHFFLANRREWDE